MMRGKINIFLLISSLLGLLLSGSAFGEVLNPMDDQVQDQVLLLKTLDSTTASTSRDAHLFFTALGLQVRPTERMTVKVYGDYQRMRKDAQMSGVRDINMLGFFRHETREIGIWYGGNMEETQRILRHEIVHEVLHRSLRHTPPAWLDEGLAEFLSRHPEALQSMGKASVHPVVKNILEQARDEKNLGDLTDLFQLNHGSFYGPAQDLHYAASYAVIAYLYETEGPRVLGNLLQAIDQGADANQWISSRVLGQSGSGDLQRIFVWALER